MGPLAIFFICILVLILLGGPPLIYFLVIAEDTEPNTRPPGMDPNYGAEAGAGAGAGAGKPGERNSSITIPGDESNDVSSSSGGLDSAPPPQDGYTPVQSYNERNPICDASLCTGDKTLRNSTKRGTTVEKCCRDKSCQIDWNPDMGGDPEQCNADGMVWDDDYTNGRDGKTNAECCKADTTSYSKWCVQPVAYRADGTKEKTSSPSPWFGGFGDVHWKKRVAGTQDTWNFGSNKEVAFSQCKNKCDQTSDCHAIYLNANGRCRLQKAAEGIDQLHSGYEKFNQNGDGREHPASGEFYIKSTFVPEGSRKQTINGELKIAGIDEEFCPLKYASIYGSDNWDAGHHPGMHINPNKLHNSGKNGCFGPGGTHHGVTLMTNKNSPEPIVRRCSELCDKFDDCGGFWAYTNGANQGMCCLKNELTADEAPSSYLTKHTTGAYFVRNKDGVMGNRPSRVSIGSAK